MGKEDMLAQPLRLRARCIQTGFRQAILALPIIIGDVPQTQAVKRTLPRSFSPGVVVEKEDF